MAASMNAPAGHHPHDGEPDLNTLAASVDGRLEPAERADLAAHLATCSQCRTIVAELARSTALTSRSWRPALAIAATLAVAATGAGAYLIVQQRERPAAMSPALIRPGTPVPPAAAAPQPPAAAAPSSAAPPSPDDRKRAAGTASVHGKTFHLVAGEWIDNAYRENDFLPVVNISSRRQMDAVPSLRPFADLGSRFTVVIRSKVYRVSIP
jgi:hypothetical protein